MGCAGTRGGNFLSCLCQPCRALALIPTTSGGGGGGGFGRKEKPAECGGAAELERGGSLLNGESSLVERARSVSGEMALAGGKLELAGGGSSLVAHVRAVSDGQVPCSAAAAWSFTVGRAGVAYTWHDRPRGRQ